MEKPYSHQMVKALIESCPKLHASPLDTPESQPPGDYSVIHVDYGEIIVEIKELTEPEELAQQFVIEKEIKKHFENLFTDKGFFCRFDPSSLPDSNIFGKVKIFLERNKTLIQPLAKKTPLKIIVPHNFVKRRSDLVIIERLSGYGSVLEILFSPETDSEKYEYGYELGNVQRSLHDKCRVTIGDNERILEERDVWSGRNDPLLEFTYCDALGSGRIDIAYNAIWLNEQERIRNKIDEANSQLKQYVSKSVPLGTIVCPVGIVAADFQSLAHALIGDPAITMDFDTRRGEVIPGSERTTFTGDKALLDKNSTTGFVGLLQGNLETQKFSLVHNAFSKYDVPYDYFSTAYVSHHIFGFRKDGHTINLGVFDVHSDGELEKFREDHQEIQKQIDSHASP